MRAALVVLLCAHAACYVTYDPIENLSFREFPDSASAVAAILEARKVALPIAAL